MEFSDLQVLIRRRLAEAGSSQHRAALESNLPQDAIRNVLAGHVPRFDRAVEICRALDIPFHIGPSRSPPDSDLGRSNPNLDPSEKAVESSEPYSVALPPDQLPDMSRVAQDLARLVSKNGGNPIPKEMQDELLRGQAVELGELRRVIEAYAFIPRYDVRLAAGSGEAADDEPLAGYVTFRRDWLLEHELHPQNLSLVEVTGRSMEPTLSNGDSVLVDHSRRQLYNSKIYALNVGGSLMVKRVRKTHGGWEAESDNPLHESSDLKQPLYGDRPSGLVGAYGLAEDAVTSSAEGKPWNGFGGHCIRMFGYCSTKMLPVFQQR